MTTYIIKFILCSGFLLAIYHLFLERERMHRFNRFYLLFAVAFSLIVPVITVQKPIPVSVSKMIIQAEATTINQTINEVVPNQKSLDVLPAIFVGLYIFISLVLLFRFIKNIKALFSRISRGKIIELDRNSRLVLSDRVHSPYSFLHYIFVNRTEFENEKIEREILRHEQAHVSQRHSWDILFMEFLLIFSWPNPILFFFRRAISLNHEFMADESVVNAFDRRQYQLLLLRKNCNESSLSFSSAFNYSFTKKRFIMMTKQTSTLSAFMKQIALIPLLSMAVFFFSENTAAQSKDPFTSISSKIPASMDLMEEYQNIINKYTHTGKKWWLKFRKEVTKADEERLAEIFSKMDREQIMQQTIVFIESADLQKKTPTKEQLESWKDSNTYGVWVDGKQISNSELKKFMPGDFSYFDVSPLMKNAVNYGKHRFEVGLMTNNYYQSEKDRIANGPKSHMAFSVKL